MQNNKFWKQMECHTLMFAKRGKTFSTRDNTDLTLIGEFLMVAACKYGLKLKSLNAKLFVYYLDHIGQAAGTCANVFILCKIEY